jgi:hypothetical protein
MIFTVEGACVGLVAVMMSFFVCFVLEVWVGGRCVVMEVGVSNPEFVNPAGSGFYYREIRVCSM